MPYIAHFEVKKREPKILHFSVEQREPKILKFEAEKRKTIRLRITPGLKLEKN